MKNGTMTLFVLMTLFFVLLPVRSPAATSKLPVSCSGLSSFGFLSNPVTLRRTGSPSCTGPDAGRLSKKGQALERIRFTVTNPQDFDKASGTVEIAAQGAAFVKIASVRSYQNDPAAVFCDFDEGTGKPGEFDLGSIEIAVKKDGIWTGIMRTERVFSAYQTFEDSRCDYNLELDDGRH